MRSFVLIANPHAGRGQAPRVLTAAAAALRAVGAPVREVLTTSIDHAGQVAEQAAITGDVAVAIGGDGILRRVVAGAARHSGTVGLVPCGRGNDFARMLGIGGCVSNGGRITGLEACIDVLLTAEPLATDCLAITTETGDATGDLSRIAIGNLYLGFDSLSNALANTITVNLGPVTYTYPALRVALTMRPLEFRLEIDGVTVDYAGSGVVIANGGYYGRGIRVAPDANIRDGLLEVIMFRQINRRRRVAALHALRAGRHLLRSDVERVRARHVHVLVEPALEAYSDGDPSGRTPLSVSALPGAVALLCP